MTAPLRRILVVGASLAGSHAAAALRRAGFDGELTLVGDEAHPPYDRPPLSKRVLLAADGTDPDVTLPLDPGLDLRWRLGRRAVALTPAIRTVTLDDGTDLPYDGLVVATGARARRWTGPGAGLEGLHYLRTLDDALTLRTRLASAGAVGAPVAVVGGGFIGAEIAAAAARLDCRVVLIEAQDHLLTAQLGGAVGDVVADTLTELGVTVLTGARLAAFDGDPGGRLTAARTTDGIIVPAVLAIVGLGAEPATGWLQGSGATLRPHLLCDQHSVVALPDRNGRVVAAGDVAIWPSPLFGGRELAVGHWSNARDQAEVAAHNLLADPADRVPHAHVPTAWSDIGPLRIRSVGLPALGDRTTITDGSAAERALLAVSTQAGRTVGAISINRPRGLPALHRLIADGAAAAAERRGALTTTTTANAPAHPSGGRSRPVRPLRRTR